jgi:DNA-binding LytR/AlgR family response regulator
MKSPTCLIAEDEAVLRAELRETLATLWPELAIVAEAEDGLQATQAFERHRPDILFLDIQMPGMSGLEVAALASRRSHVVFVTAFDKYAVEAFRQGAIDYVLKPFAPARLADTVGRLKERLRERPADLDGLLALLARGDAGSAAPLRWVRASTGADVRLITVDEILYFQADSKYTLVVTADAEAVIRTPIQELARRLDPEVFCQIHRGTIVNLAEVAAVHRHANGTLELALKRHPRRLVVSVTFAHHFKQM